MSSMLDGNVFLIFVLALTILSILTLGSITIVALQRRSVRAEFEVAGDPETGVNLRGRVAIGEEPAGPGAANHPPLEAPRPKSIATPAPEVSVTALPPPPELRELPPPASPPATRKRSRSGSTGRRPAKRGLGTSEG
mgnify:CR=1 FL=1